MKKLIFIIFLGGFALLGLLGCIRKERSSVISQKKVQKYFPQVHFARGKNWQGQPAGLVYYKDRYHLFYEYNPEEPIGSNRHWGHATSKDLIHWEHAPVALAPDSLGEIFSGCVVIDKNNTSGLGTQAHPPMLAYYTQYDPEKPIFPRCLSLAYSLDEGFTWQSYSNNPLKLMERKIGDYFDPQIVWYPESNQWILCLASDAGITFFSSKDCLHWEYQSELPNNESTKSGWWRKPDLFKIKVTNTNDTKWVLLLTNGNGPTGESPGVQYIVGNFDGKQFIPCQENIDKYNFWLDYGKDYNGSSTCLYKNSNKRVIISWMNCWSYAGQEPTKDWSGSFSFPRELELTKDQSLYLLIAKPVKEIEQLVQKRVIMKNQRIEGSMSHLFKDLLSTSTAWDIQLNFDIAARHSISFPEKYGLRLKNRQGEYFLIEYNNLDNFFYINRSNCTLPAYSDLFNLQYKILYPPKTDTFTWRIIVDNNSIEFFADNHRLAITNTVYPSELFDTLELFTDMGSVNLLNISCATLHSIWE